VANIDLSLESLPVQNVVPPELRSCQSISEFMDRLSEFDDYFDRMNADAATRGEVLRYVGVVQDAPGKNGRTSEVALKRFVPGCLWY
jgi:homoserine dehydrogenase